jgi:phosphatidate cytidylyltransferase
LSNIVTRTLSGAVFITIVIGSVLLHPYACAGMMAVVIVWAMLEYYDIVTKDRIHAGKFLGVFTGVALFAAVFFYAQDIVSSRVFLFIIPLLMLLFISQLYSSDLFSFRAIAYTLTGVVYIALPFALCTGMMFPSTEGRFLNPDGKYTPDLLLGFFILLWTNDTFAYLTGIMFGKHRLFERISPKKSWEGFVGGLVCTVALSLLIAEWFPILPFYHWMAVATIIVVFGVYGDLVESLLKRNLKIKDSGRFLPGHGGILDRFDSVLLAAPMVYFYLKLVVF